MAGARHHPHACAAGRSRRHRWRSGDSHPRRLPRLADRDARAGRGGLVAIVMHPGWVRTDMGGAMAPLSVEESVSGIRQVIDRLTPADHGRFLTWEGREHPW